MTNWLHSWRAAVRIARRDAWRAKGRSFLVLAMIALPILGVSALDLTVRSSELTVEQTVARKIGAADARLIDSNVAGVPVLQDPKAEQSTPVEDYSKSNKPWPSGTTDVPKTVPAGSKILTDSTGTAKLTTTHGLLQTEVRELKATDPLADGIMWLTEGRFPQKNDEIAATTGFLKSSGLKVGSTLSARGYDREYRITGAYELPSDLKVEQVNALPGAFLAPYGAAVEKAGSAKPETLTTYLVGKSGGFTWNDVQEINKKGVTVYSRAVQLDPPADSAVPLFQRDGWGAYQETTRASELAILVTVVGLAMLEVCLLAGPAFAVGARRSRRQLGLVGSNGGTRGHIRAIVLSGGLVIGAASAVVGVILAMLLTLALRPVLEDYMGQRFGGFNVRPLELLAIAAVAVLTGLLAAIVPAITASRTTVLASLTGRRGVRRTSRVLPVLGLVALLLGGAIALYGSALSDRVIVVAGGSALAELGVVAMTPALVGLFGRTGRWLPLSPRLALRDAVRNRGRTAPAVAAVLAAVAGTVAVSTYAASSEAESRAGYEAKLPHGVVAAFVTEEGGRDVPAVREAVQRFYPVDQRADVSRINVGKPGCDAWGNTPGCGRFEIVIPPANECPLWVSLPDGSAASDKYTPQQRRDLQQKDWRCKPSHGGGISVPNSMIVADAAVLKILGITDPGAAKALADGKILSFSKSQVDKKGAVGIRVITDTAAYDRAAEQRKPLPGTVKSFPAYEVPGDAQAYGVQSILSPAAAKAAGLSTLPMGGYYTTDRLPDTEQRQKLDGEIAKLGSNVELTLEEGYVSKNNLVQLALSIFAGLVTIGAAGIATGLAQADAEADLKTLAAVGAPGRVRRTLSGFQCGVVAAMGVVLGSAAGLLPAIALRLTQQRESMGYYEQSLAEGWGALKPPELTIVVPWATLAGLIVAVPIGAAVLAALVTRSRGALARRAAH